MVELWDEPSERLRDLETAEVAPDIISSYLALPGLRGFWPMSSVGRVGAVVGQAVDLQGLGNHLIRFEDPVFNHVGLAPYCDYSGAADCDHKITDAASGGAFDIIGDEVYIAGAVQGLTIGGWFYFDRLTQEEDLIGKWGGFGNYSYLVRKLASDDVVFQVSDNGVAIIPSPTFAVAQSTWHFVVGVFSPSGANNEVRIHRDGDIASNAAGIATLNLNDIEFEISGSDRGRQNILDGRASLCFVCAEAASRSIVGALYQQTRSVFGV